LRFFIAGSNDEKYLSEEILGQLGKDIQVTDLTGLLTLPQLVDHIKGAHLLVSNETSAIHIAAAVGTTAICISNGNHFGRFNPYPVTIAPGIFTFYPDDRFYKPEYHNQLVEECRKQSELDINAIEVTEVAEKAVELLLKNKPFEII
jgi:ADP-heptose:LPS heptosyltransferase